jgi:hypothetical protein
MGKTNRCGLNTCVERVSLLALQCAGCEPCKVRRFAEGLQCFCDMQRAWQSHVGLRGQQSSASTLTAIDGTLRAQWLVSFGLPRRHFQAGSDATMLAWDQRFSPKTMEPRNNLNTRKQGVTVQGFPSVCSAYSVVEKKDRVLISLSTTSRGTNPLTLNAGTARIGRICRYTEPRVDGSVSSRFESVYPELRYQIPAQGKTLLD